MPFIIGAVSSGAGDSVSVPQEFVFATELERNTYFAENPGKLKDGVFVVTGNDFQRYDQTTSSFVNQTTLIQGPKGDSAPKTRFQFSVSGVDGWEDTIDPARHIYWRWSTDGGVIWSPDSVRFKPEGQDQSKFGYFNYDNSVNTQMIPAGVWTTLENDALGSETNTAFSPPDIDRMLDPITGRILLDKLLPGDEVYIRHTVNVTPLSNGANYSFSHLFGEEGTLYRLPIGVPTTLNEGGGVPTGDFLVDTHFFVRDSDIAAAGMLPQIFVTNPAVINYTGCYISVTRR